MRLIFDRKIEYHVKMTWIKKGEKENTRIR